ncbi:MAG TPA: LuxR C-terminal-related transcriptional regulator [Polyangiaceae bacterium]|nr:LuxR C-terminal-related transcriptional regulator [Polyangiaceae bacterium]
MNTASLVKLRREQAAASDLSSAEQSCLAELWRGLVSGSSRVVDGFFSDERCYLVVRQSACRGEELSGRRLAILEQILRSGYQLCVAIDLQLAPSTITSSARSALETLGASGRPSRVHPIIMLAAIAAGNGTRRLANRSTMIEEASSLQVWSIPRPELRCASLSPAELAVVKCLVEGLSYEEIGQLRGTANRTIANQIASVYRRLGISGRNGLLHYLLTLDDSHPGPPTKPAPANSEQPFTSDCSSVPLVSTSISVRRIA